MNASESHPNGCWRCGRPLDDAIACAACDAPQPLAADADHFALLGVPRALAVDVADLERRYHAASRRVHPDRHQTGDARAQQLSVAASAAVNRAYRTLRDPVARGKYWLGLHGLRLNDDNRVPPSLAALVFETQEQLEALRASRGDTAAQQRAEVETTRRELDARLQAHLDALAVADPAALEPLKQRLAEINYLRTLLGDVEDALGEPRGTDRRH